MPLTGNIGEWSEIYIFLKILTDGKIFAADAEMQKIKDVFLNVIKIIREENKDFRFDYFSGSTIKIYLNDSPYGPDYENSEYLNIKKIVWDRIKNSPHGNTITIPEADDFFKRIHVTKLKAPATSNSSFGGTEDITMQVQDYRNGVTSVIGFSCKSEAGGKATLFNASNDNTNFVYRISGPINDEIMDHFNSIFKTRMSNGFMKEIVPIQERIKFLKECDCGLEFVGTKKENAERNIVQSGGIEMPGILAEMLRYYYFIHEGAALHSSVGEALEHITKVNPAGYRFGDIESLYRKKVGTLLYDFFTGMRLGTPWDGKSSVNGGYIVAKNDGDVVAFHSCMADEFKSFLIEKLGLEAPSAQRHNYMCIYKEDQEYYLNLNLQIRFKF